MTQSRFKTDFLTYFHIGLQEIRDSDAKARGGDTT